jgi:hypothetical protein
MDIESIVFKDPGAPQLLEVHAQQIERFQTYYIYVPFQDVSCPQIAGGYVPAGRIHAIDPPERRAQMRELPSQDTGMNINILRIEGPNNDVAVYLDQPKVIVQQLLTMYGREGATEISALRGMAKSEFARVDVNRLIFGERPPTTAKAIREHLGRLGDQLIRTTTAGSQKLLQIIEQVLAAVTACEVMCQAQIRTTHTQFDMARRGDPDSITAYSRRDLRAIEFAGITPQNEAINRVAAQQEQDRAVQTELLKELKAQNDRWEALASDMKNAVQSVADVMKAVTGNGGDRKSKG